MSPDSTGFGTTLYALLNALVVDYCARQKLGGTSFSYYVLKQVPVPAPMTCRSYETVGVSFTTDWFAARVLELAYCASDVSSFARDCGYDGPPFRWDEERRFEIRAELDAAFFHLYLPCDNLGEWKPAERETPEQLAALKRHFATPRDAVRHILEQFPLVRQRDEQAHGHYRTRDRILEIYDLMLAAQRSGRPYQTALDPPPGDPRAAHGGGR